jgi:galactose-1-phosphate uridylyltransferase
MSIYENFYHLMPDGTIKQINPFNGTEVWCVEERKRGPAINVPPEISIPLEKRSPEDYCHFCEANYDFCTPEKARVYQDNEGKWQKFYNISPEELNSFSADFRRVGNLFEIVTFDYWVKNYHHQLNKAEKKWKEAYLSSPKGYEHAIHILKLKMLRLGIDFNDLSEEERLKKIDPFFGGCHELIIGKRHYKKDASFSHELCSSGELTAEEHFQYFKFTIESIVDIYEQNPFVRYVSVFQNWLRPAGASFDHMHRQLVALDEWGAHMEREICELQKNPNLYNDFAINFAVYNSFLIAENDFAIALVEIGHRYPTIAIYSKSEKSRPFEQTEQEIRGMSEIVHTIHTVITSQTTCNEEWYYAPFDSISPLPWHISIKLRVHTPAGFEGNTKIYINPISPQKLKDEIVEALYEKRSAGSLSPNIRIGDEISRRPNILNYYKAKVLDTVK